MYNLPLILDLLKVIKFRPPDGTAFEQAHVKFEIKDRRVEFERIDFFGNAVSLGGHGSMGLDGKDLNLDFYAVPFSQRLPAMVDQVASLH